MRDLVVNWIAKIPATAVLVVLEGDVHAESGEIVYQARGQVSRHLPANSVSLKFMVKGKYGLTFS
jgi:hypothetical protein